MDLQFGRLIQYAYQQGFGPTPIAVDPTPIGFRFVQTLMGNGNAEAPCCYGIVAERLSDGYRVAAIRGTADPSEWVEDGEFWPERSPWGPGKTEGGFTDVVESICGYLAPGVPVTLGQLQVKAVVGHSLGAAVAEGLAAKYGLEYAGLWACPRLGDAAFVQFLLSRVKTVLRLSVAGDIVPQVPLDLPPIFAYQHPPGQLLQPADGTPSDWPSRHALVTYLTAVSMIVPRYGHEGEVLT